MRSPIVEIEVRWRQTGTDGWQSRRFLPGAKIEIPEITRAESFDVQARSIGVRELMSDWVAATVAVPATNRRGALALPPNVVLNQSSMWGMDTTVTYAAASPETGDATATISMSAGSLVVGTTSLTYAASSATVTGAPSTSKTVYLYYDDPKLEGGARVLGVAETPVAAANVYGRIAITSVKVTFPAPGGTGGGGGGIGGGGGGGGPHQPIYDENPL